MIVRSESDYGRIASVLLDCDLDIIAVQEIENSDALEKVVSRMPGYSFVLSDFHSDQRLGFIYRSNIQNVECKDY